MMGQVKLEICSFSIQGCLNANTGGADRIELCSSPLEGGVTPSYGLVKQVKEIVHIPIYPIVRPRAGNFIYSADEFQIMINDILAFKNLECNGIALGFQRSDGSVDTEKLKYITDLAWPMGVTFIRAFDLVPEPFKAIDALIDCGCERILTSGQSKYAFENKLLIKELVNYAGPKISIMAGSGIRPDNVESIIRDTGIKEVHTSVREVMRNTYNSDTENFMFGCGFDCNLNQIKEIRAIIDKKTI